MTVTLHLGDCLEYMHGMADIDLIFADPKFNVGKDYGESVDDNMPRGEYLAWCKEWLKECYSILRPGGSIYVMNLQENAAHHSVQLEELGANVQNIIAWRETQWVTPKIRYSKGYQAIVFATKPGAPHTFNCFADTMPHDRHWGGKEKYKHPDGARLTDIWQDISRVKGNFGEAIKNEFDEKAHPCQMPVKLAERIIKVSSNQGDVIFDPFFGSGTTAEACLNLNRNFIGCEINPDYYAIAEKRIRQAQEARQLELI